MYQKFKWTNVSQRRNALTKVYEPIQPYILFSLADELSDFAFYDIGANIGVYSIFISSHPKVKDIHIFEPMAECIKEIKSNVEANGLKNLITTHSVALSSSSGTIRFKKVSDYSGANGVSSTFLFPDVKAQGEIDVPIEKLDNIVKERNRNIVLKIDVEGHEYDVIRGATTLLSNNTGFIQIEIHDSSPHRQNIFELLNSMGWKKIINISWDYYFTNIDRIQNDSDRVKFIEKSLTFFVDQSLSEIQPVRRQIFSGLTVELSRTLFDKIMIVLAPVRRIFKK
jgi:FkbM family methyltransferase